MRYAPIEWGRHMQDPLTVLQLQAAGLFAATILLVVFFLIARIANARQLVALAFAVMPLLLVWAAQGLIAAEPALTAL